MLIGDVVGLGKTLMATALARIFQEDHFTETLIICPKKLVKMWEDYVSEYRLLAKVLSVTRATSELGRTPHAALRQALAEKRSVIRPAPQCPWWPCVWSQQTRAHGDDDGQVPVGDRRYPIHAPPRRPNPSSCSMPRSSEPIRF